MIRSFFLIITLFIGCSRAYCQVIAEKKEIISIYKKIKFQTPNVYLADTSLTNAAIDYNFIQYYVAESQKQLVKKILNEGVKKYIPIDTIEKIINVKDTKITPYVFSAIKKEPLKLTKEESLLMRYVDSISNLPAISHEERVKKINAAEFQLSHNNNYLELKKKLQRNKKWLLYFPPIYQWRNYSLIVVQAYNSITESYPIVTILKRKSKSTE